jgi:hypothetical protein
MEVFFLINKRLIASMGCAALILSSISITSYAESARMFTTVDVVSAATTWKEPAKPAAKPAAKPVAKPAAKPVAKPTTTSDLAVTNGEITRFLALNSVGNDVKLVQTWLNDNGYVLNVDGIYGKLTLNAVKGYQSKNGLRADGIIGPKTLAKLTPIIVAEKPVEPVKPVEPAKPIEPAKPVEPSTPVDVVTSASIVDNAADFEKGISKDGAWIICTLNDLTFEKELVLEGEFKNGKKNADGTDAIQRKIAPYTQETLEDGTKKVIDRFTITAPKLTINSPNARIQAGTFKGDIYVNVPNFQLVDATVEGNIYFLDNEAKDTFKVDEKSSILGRKILINVDATSTASIVSDEEAFEKAISKDGTWIGALLKDLTFFKPITMEGEFKNNDKLDRKIGLYTSKTLEDKSKVFTHNQTLAAPKLFITSPMARMLRGTFIGNIYVSSDNFRLEEAKVEGNVYFTTQSAMDTFDNVNSIITGEKELVELDAVTSASLVTDADTLEKSMSKHGVWITCLESDITTDKELTLEGNFRGTKFVASGVDSGTLGFDRKLALYTQDDKRNVTGEFTLKTPKLTVNVPNARIENGTIEGDIYISATGVKLKNTKVIGNVYFTNQEAQDTFKPEGTFSISGVQELKK